MNKEQADFKESLLYFLEPSNYTLNKITKGRGAIVGGMQDTWYTITPIMDEEKGTPLVSDLLLCKRVKSREGSTVEFRASAFFEELHIPTEEEINFFLLTNKDMSNFMVHCLNSKYVCYMF